MRARRAGGRRDARRHPRRGCGRVSPPPTSTGSARDVLDRRGATSELPRLPRLPGGDLRVGQRGGDPRHPRPRGPRRGRRAVDRLRRDRRRLARRRRVHDGRSATITAEAQRLIDTAERALAAGDRGDGARRPRRRRRRGDRRRRRGGRLRQPARLLRPRDRPGDARGPGRRRTAAGRGKGAELAPGVVLAIEPMLIAGGADDVRRARRRLDRRHRRRLARRPRRAHGRRHRRRPRDPHPPLATATTAAAPTRCSS